MEKPCHIPLDPQAVGSLEKHHGHGEDDQLFDVAEAQTGGGGAGVDQHTQGCQCHGQHHQQIQGGDPLADGPQPQQHRHGERGQKDVAGQVVQT